MLIFLAENGQKTGPFQTWEVRSRLERKEITLETLAWHEGCESWIPLNKLPALGLANRTEESPPPPLPEMTPEPERGMPRDATPTGMDTRPRPWLRLLARLMDQGLLTLILACIVRALGYKFSTFLLNPGWALSMPLIMLVMEAFCLHHFGTTPGKALLGMRVVCMGSSANPPPLPVAFQRSMLVVAIGHLLYLDPFLTVGAWIFHYIGLMRHRRVWWDRKLGLDIAGRPLTMRMVLQFILVWLVVHFVTINVVGEEDLRFMFDTMFRGFEHAPR